MILSQTKMKMETLYERLEAISLPEKFVREQALPDWWDEEFEHTPGAVVEAAACISRRLNLDINSLLEPSSAPAFKRSCIARFKTKQGIVVNELLITHCIAARIAEMAAYACTTEFRPVSDSASVVRNKILSDREFVDLEGLNLVESNLRVLSDAKYVFRNSRRMAKKYPLEIRESAILIVERCQNIQPELSEELRNLQIEGLDKA
jgi:hypothetical protein